MKTSTRIVGLSLLAAGFLMSAQTGESAPAAVPSPVASAPVADARAGKEAFTEKCSICHGVGAQGFIGPSIAGVNWGTAGLHAIVRGGLGGYGSMPAFNADAVTDKNIADIAAYLAVLRSEASPPASPAPSPAPAPPASATSAASAAPLISSGDPIRGHQIYMENCAACHGAGAQGGVGPNLHGEQARKDTAAAIAWIKNPRLPMPKLYPNPLSEQDVDDVAAFVESL